jgi:hypothetical protein
LGLASASAFTPRHEPLTPAYLLQARSQFTPAFTITHSLFEKLQFSRALTPYPSTMAVRRARPVQPAKLHSVSSLDLKNTAEKLRESGTVAQEFHAALQYSLHVAFQPKINERRLQERTKRKRTDDDDGKRERESPTSSKVHPHCYDEDQHIATTSPPSTNTKQSTRTSRAVYEARHQWKRAHRIYLEALKKGGAFFLAFLVCISPWACKETKTVRPLLDKEASSLQELELDLGMATLFRKWANADGYSTNSDFTYFFAAVISEGVFLIPLCHVPTNNQQRRFRHWIHCTIRIQYLKRSPPPRIVMSKRWRE